jgi:hypothetical protein
VATSLVGRLRDRTPRCLIVGQGVEHDTALGHRGVDGKLSVSRLKTNSLALRAMSGAIEIPQLAKTHGDAREATTT